VPFEVHPALTAAEEVRRGVLPEVSCDDVQNSSSSRRCSGRRQAALPRNVPPGAVRLRLTPRWSPGYPAVWPRASGAVLIQAYESDERQIGHGLDWGS